MADATIITSRYVQIDQTPASVAERIVARLTDLIICMLYFVALFFFFDWLLDDLMPHASNDLTLTLLVCCVLPAMFYSLLWEYFNRGQTPGKKLLGIRVVMKDGSAPSFGAYLMRWMLLLVDVHLSYCIGVISILLTKDRQRIGDLAAHTLVIKEKDYHRINVTLDEFRHLGAGYRPVFPQADNLSLEQVNLIRTTLATHDEQSPYRIRELAAKVRSFLQINPTIADDALLQTLIRDYQYYALEEI
ncbi:MAG: RDD family protein [Tannerella sp.]|jgi:uncharacterized RDD family membrane protein YckC|nr:RDD family protein [Tannerella sp.]